MQALIDFIVKYKEYITFIALVVISLSLISISNVSKIGGFRAAVVGLIGATEEVFAWIPNPNALKNENSALRELNLELSTEVSRMRNALVENKKLRAMMEFEETTDLPVIAAEVVGKSLLEMRNYITINKGKNDSIVRGMTVRTDAGLVGTIIGVSNHYSLVELIANRNVKISAKIERTLTDGVISWRAGNEFLLNNVPSSFDAQVGDKIVTSNYSNKFPEKIPIGQIIEVNEDQGSLFYVIKVEPNVNFYAIDQVFVILHEPDSERMKLLENMEKYIISGVN